MDISLIGAILLLLTHIISTIICLKIGIGSLIKRYKVKSNGIKTKATIINIFQTHKHGAQRRYAKYLVELNFKNKSGIMIHGIYNSKGNYFSRFSSRAGQEVDIIYCEDNHTEFYLPNDKEELAWNSYYLMLGLMMLSLILGAMLVLFRFGFS